MSDANGGWLPAGDKYELSLDGGRVIATANLRDRGVSEMSAALKRRFNFELVEPIADEQQEQALIERQATAALARVGAHFDVDRQVLEALVTTFRDLRLGRSAEGWTVERPGTVMSTAPAHGPAGGAAEPLARPGPPCASTSATRRCGSSACAGPEFTA